MNRAVATVNLVPRGVPRSAGEGSLWPSPQARSSVKLDAQEPIPPAAPGRIVTSVRQQPQRQRHIILRRATVFDTDQLSDIIPGANIEHRLLTPGRFEARAIHVETARFRLDVLRYSTSVALQGELPTGGISLAFALAKPEEIVAFGIPQRSVALTQFDATSGLDIRLPSGGEWALLTVETDVFEAELMRRQPGAMARQGMEGRPLRIPGPHWRRVVACLKAIIAEATRSPGDPCEAGNAPSLDEALADTVVAAYIAARVPQSLDHGALARRRRLVARTEEYLFAHIDDTIHMKRLCREVGASARTLEYAFKGVYGSGVMESLRTLRLNEVRKKLLRSRTGEVTITTAAMDWGFWHLGEFAAAYKRLFGELPSRSLQKGKLLPTRIGDRAPGYAAGKPRNAGFESGASVDERI